MNLSSVGPMGLESYFRRITIRGGVLAFLLTAASLARADVSIHGFGQIVVGSTLSNDHVFYNQSYGADPNFDKESLFAVQIEAPLSQSLEATAQFVASGANNNDFTPVAEWAYASYWLDDAWIIKGGRQRVPLYRYSDFLEVGQSYPWVRPPPAVYQNVITNFDGLSATGYFELGRWTLQPELLYGTFNRTTEDLGVSASFNLKNATGLVLEGSYAQWLSLRASGFYSNGSVDTGFFDPLVQFALPYSTANNSAVIAAFSPNNHSVIFYGGSVDLHPGHYILNGEYVGIRFNDTAIFRYNEYYISGGYRFGEVTPLLTYGHVDGASSDPGILGLVAPGSMCPTTIDPLSRQPAGYVPCSGLVATAINANRQLGDYYEAGLRFDLTPNTALKLDWTRYLSHEPPGYGFPGFSHESNLVSAAFTFAF